MNRTPRRASAPRLNAIASCVLAAFGVAVAGSIVPGIAHAAPGTAQSNRGAATTPASSQERRAANRVAFRSGSSLLANPTRPAGAIVVTNCDDAGPGSLRQAVVDAVDGDVIDLSSLACST